MSDGSTSGEGIGQPVRRKEDLRLLTGQGHYAADHAVAGMAFAAMVRSPHAHARIRAIDTGGGASGARRHRRLHRRRFRRRRPQADPAQADLAAGRPT